MSILALGEEHFVMSHRTLGIKVKGLVLVLFKLSDDGNSRKFEPTFAKLSMLDKRVYYGIVDIGNYPNIIRKSKDSSTPINGIPTLILYIEGKPHAKFNGSNNIESIQDFMTKALNMKPPQPHPPQQNMYGVSNGAPSDPRYAKNVPEHLGRAPSLKGTIKGYNVNQGFVEEDDDPKLTVPSNVTPWNVPWEAELHEKDEGM